MPHFFSTRDGAASAALVEAAGRTRYDEYGGLIYRQDGRYWYSDPLESNSRSGLRIKLAVPKGATVAGIYHTHPRQARNLMFSPDDVAMARQLGVPSYVHDVDTGEQIVFRADDDVTARGASRGQPLVAPVFPGDTPSLRAPSRVGTLGFSRRGSPPTPSPDIETPRQ